MNRQQSWIFLSHVFGTSKEIIWETNTTVCLYLMYSLWFKLVLLQNRKEAERSQTDEEMPQIYFFFFKKKLYILSDDNLCNVFVPCSLLHAFSFSLLSRSCTVALCLSFTRFLCNQIGLSYTSTAL